MRYFGIEVHSKACVRCSLNPQGEIVEQGSTETTIPALQALVTCFGSDDERLVGQEVGALAHLVHDALKGRDLGARVSTEGPGERRGVRGRGSWHGPVDTTPPLARRLHSARLKPQASFRTSGISLLLVGHVSTSAAGVSTPSRTQKQPVSRQRSE